MGRTWTKVWNWTSGEMTFGENEWTCVDCAFVYCCRVSQRCVGFESQGYVLGDYIISSHKHTLDVLVARLVSHHQNHVGLIARAESMPPSFPATSWQAALIRTIRNRRPRNETQRYGHGATLVSARLYLSDLSTVQAPGTLRYLGITHVVSALEADVSRSFDTSVVFMHVPIRDSLDTDIARWFDCVVNFIYGALAANQRNRVLVHCFQGVSRSVTLVCAYLVATTTMRATETIEYVRSKRGIVAPNAAFRQQLILWGQRYEQWKLCAEAENHRRRQGGSGVRQPMFPTPGLMFVVPQR